MSTSSYPPNDEESALWFARRRRGVMTLEERAAFESWCRVPANAAAMAEFDQVWTILQVAQDRMGPTPGPVQAPRPKRIAASALLAVMCAVSIGIGVISFSGNRDFWTSLDWVDR